MVIGDQVSQRPSDEQFQVTAFLSTQHYHPQSLTSEVNQRHGTSSTAPGGQISALNGRSPGPKAHGVHQEPRPAADDRHVAQGHGRDPGPPRGRAAVVGQPRLGRWHAGQGPGPDEEFPAEGGDHAARQRSGQPARTQRHHRGSTPDDRDRPDVPVQPAGAAMPKSTSGARRGPMPPVPRPPTRRRGSARRRRAPGRCSASSAMR